MRDRRTAFIGDRSNHRGRFKRGLLWLITALLPVCWRPAPQSLLPLVSIDANKMVLIAGFEEQHPFAHQRVAKE